MEFPPSGRISAREKGASAGRHAERTMHQPLPAGRRQVLRGLLRHLQLRRQLPGGAPGSSAAAHGAVPQRCAGGGRPGGLLPDDPGGGGSGPALRRDLLLRIRRFSRSWRRGASDVSSIPPKTAESTCGASPSTAGNSATATSVPATISSAGRSKRALVELLDDWYLYGLCITDIDLVKDYFRHIGERLGETPASGDVPEGAGPAIARRFFAFKVDWPFRSPEINRFGRFYFDGSQHMIRPIDYAALGCERSRYDGIFLSLSSLFRNRRELQRAEGMIRENVEAVAAACRRPLLIFVDRASGVV